MLLILFKTYCISVLLSFIVTSFLCFDKASKHAGEHNCYLSTKGIILGTFVVFLLSIIPIYNIYFMCDTIKRYVNN
jgi:hypothetical protein